MEKEILAELARWGQAGYSVLLQHGMTWRDDQMVIGWMCSIHHMPRGSVEFIGSPETPPFGFHATDPAKAARDALRQAAERWPEMAGGSL